MSYSVRTFAILTSHSDTELITMRAKVIFPFIIHRTVECFGNQWRATEKKNSRGYTMTHMLTGFCVVSIRTAYAGCGMVEARHRLESLATKLAEFPEFLLTDREGLQNGPNRKAIQKTIKEAKLWA